MERLISFHCDMPSANAYRRRLEFPFVRRSQRTCRGRSSFAGSRAAEPAGALYAVTRYTSTTRYISRHSVANANNWTTANSTERKGLLKIGNFNLTETARTPAQNNVHTESLI